MKIVQTVTLVSEDGAFGGPLAVAIEQCRELARRGHMVTLLAAWDGKIHLSIPGVRVVLSRGQRIPGTGFRGVRAPALVHWLEKNRNEIDVLHVHAGRHAIDLELASRAKQLKIPFFLQTHGMVMPRSGPTRLLDYAITKPLLRSAAGVFVLTDDEATGVRAIEPDAHVQVVRNGLAVADRPIAADTDQPEVLFLARLHPRKRVLAFAEMARLLTVEGAKARFSVVGPDEGDLHALEQFCAENPDVPLAYDGPISPGKGASRIAQAAVYVLPSHGEVFPVTVLEALAAGTVVVLTDDCGIADRLTDADAALVSDGSPADLATSVARLLLDGKERARLIANGRALIEGELGIGATMDEIEPHYDSAVRRRSRPTVVWVTNQAAPYRIPVWESLAKHVNLEVWLLESDRALHRDQNNRGSDWEVRGREFPFSIRTIPTYAVRRGEARHYIAAWIGRRSLEGVDGVLLGGWDSPAYWTVARAARRAGARRVGFYESHLLTQHNKTGPFAAARQRFYRSLDGVVVPGVAARDALLHQGVDDKKISLGFNAVDVERINADTTAEREQQNRKDNHLKLLVISQLIERKNVGEAIRALLEPGMEHATLTIVGTGALAADLARLVGELELAHRVALVGYVSSSALPKVFADHDVLVHPALEEVWGLVVNEALAAGLQVVVSDRCGVAASVEQMPGVAVVIPTAAAIAAAVRPIRQNTIISDPNILLHTPAKFAEVFASAFGRNEPENCSGKKSGATLVQTDQQSGGRTGNVET